MKSSHIKTELSPLFCASDAIKLCKPKESLSLISKCRSLSSLSSKPTTDSNLQQTDTEKRRNSLPGNLKFGPNHSINFPESCASKVKLKDFQPPKKPKKCLVGKRKDWHQNDFVKPLRSSPRHRKAQRKVENDLTKTGCDSLLSTTDKNNISAYLTETSQMSLENSDESQDKKESEFPVNNRTTVPKAKSSESRNTRKRKTKSHSNSDIHEVANSQIIEQNNNDITCNPVSEHSAKRKKRPNRTEIQSLTVTDYSDEKNHQNNGNSCKPKSEHCAKRKKGQEKQSNTVSDSIQSHYSCLIKSSKSKKSKSSSEQKTKKKRLSVSQNNLDSLDKLPELNYPKRLQLPSSESSEHSVSGSVAGKPKTFNHAQIPDLTKESDVAPKLEIPDISSSRMCKSSSVRCRSKRKRDNSEERTPDQSEDKNQDENDSDGSDILGRRPGFSHFDPNLNEESCVESDDDLPDFLSPSHDVLCSPKVNEYVWVKWKKDPFWPCKIVAVEKNKVKVTFFGYKENSYAVPYNNGAVVPFRSSRASEFIENGRKHKLKEKFNKGYKEITNEILDKYIQNDPPCIDKHTPSEDQFADSFYSLTNGSDESFKVDPINTTPVKSKKSRPRSLSLDVKITPKMKEKYVQQIERLKEKNMKLIEFIKSNQMKEYLEGIYHGTIKSELHDKYTSCEHGKREMEEISLEFLEESQWSLLVCRGSLQERPKAERFEEVDEVVGVLVKWYEKLTGNALSKIAYIINVWLHEAVVYSLVKVRKYNKKKAWQIYTAPRKPTRIAEIIQHQQMITSTDSLETRLARLRPPPKMTLK